MAVGTAVEQLIRNAISQIQISDANGVVLAEVPYPGLEARAINGGIAFKWRISDRRGALIQSGKIGDGLALDRLDIQAGGVVSISKLEIEVTDV